MTAYYVVSESLTNAAKYADTPVVDVAVAADDGALRVEVRDDGRGGADPAEGSGLLGLKDRVEAIGGTMHLTSPPGAGTSLRVELPLVATRPPAANRRKRYAATRPSSAGTPPTLSVTSMLPRVALEYGQSWCARLIRSRPCSRVSCGASRSSAAASPKPPLFTGPIPTRAVIRESLRSSFAPGRDPKQRALETGGVADGEQLLGIRPRPARAAHLAGNIERDIHTAVARPRVPLTATDGGRLGGVEDLESVVHHPSFRSGRATRARFSSRAGVLEGTARN